MTSAPWGNEAVDPPELPMRHARRGAWGQLTPMRFVLWAFAVITVGTLIGLALFGHWVPLVTASLAASLFLRMYLPLKLDEDERRRRAPLNKEKEAT